MALPASTITKLDGNLGLTGQNATKPLVVGPCSSGTANTVYTFGSINSLIATLGNGPAVTQAAILLNDAGGSVDVIRSAASIAATSGSFVSGTVPSVALTGTPRDTYDFIGVITTGGTRDSDAVRFKYSLDGGETYTSPMQVTASNGALSLQSTGLTLTFGTGTYTAGEETTFVTHAPTMNGSDLDSALDAYEATAGENSDIYIANDPVTAAQGVTVLNTLDTHLTSMANLYQYIACVAHLGGQGESDATKITQANTFSFSTGQGGMVTVHRCRRTVPVTYPGYANPELPFSMLVASHTQQRDLSSSPAAKRFGKLAGASEPTYDEFLDGELFLPAALVAPRTFRGTPGVFINQASLKSASTSDYRYYQWLRVLNRAATIVQQRLEFYVNDDVKTKTDGTGQIDPPTADAIESDVNGALAAELINVPNQSGRRGHCSGVKFAIDRTGDVLTTSRLNGTCAVIPFSNLGTIATTLFFSRELS